MAKYFNQQKIEYVKRVLNGEHPTDVARDAGVTPTIIHQWCAYHRAGMFAGREALCTVVLNGRKKHMTPQRVESIVSDYVSEPTKKFDVPALTRAAMKSIDEEAANFSKRNPFKDLMRDFKVEDNQLKYDPMILVDLLRRVSMLEKVVLR